MLKGFICPRNKQKCTLEDCKSCTNPCLPLPILITAMRQREINPAVLHVTQILAPAWQLYLMATEDYWESPFDLFFKMYGSSQHYFLESASQSEHFPKEDQTEVSLAFIWVEGTQIIGSFDYYDSKRKALYDWKAYAKFKVQKCKEDVFENAPELVLQLNIYRLMFSEPVDHLFCLALVRDWRAYEYKQTLRNNEKSGRGEKNRKGAFYRYEDPVNCMELIRVPLIPWQTLSDTVGRRIQNIKDCFDTGQGVCDEDERWNDKRCTDYCPVKDKCPYGKTIGD